MTTNSVYKERRSQRITSGGIREIVIRTFTGTTEEDYDEFCESRFLQDCQPRWRVGRQVDIAGKPCHAQYEFRADGGEI